MYYRYQPYPYYKRFYNVSPYHYGRYYNPYYGIYDSQIANVNQRLINYGNMTDVIQDSDIYQLRTPPEENVGESTEPPVEAPVEDVPTEPTV